MTPDQYLSRFDEVLKNLYQTTAAKNHDYAGGEDAFSNFRLIEDLGVCPTEVGILTRMSDKFARVCRLLGKEARVAESVSDTLIDLAVYAIILKIYLEQYPMVINPVEVER